jgi:hypothetical protein
VRDTRGVRATGLQGDTSVDIIEIIDDSTDAFGDRGPNATIYDSGGPRWLGPVAAAVLIGVVVWGVATSASGNDPAKVASSPSTTAVPTTAVAPTTTLAAPLVPYYAADPPRGLTVQSATMQDPQDNYYGPSTYQLWAQPGATAGSGSWFSVESYPGSGPGTFAINAYRMQVDALSLAISRTSDRQAVVQFSPAGKASVTMTTSGLGDDDIVAIAQQIRVVRNLVQFGDRAAVDGYDMISTMQPWTVIQGVPVEQVFYADSSDPLGGFVITVSQRHPGNPGGSDINRETALRFLLEGDRVFFDVDGNNAIAGDVIGQDNYSLASWTAGDHIVTVSGSMAVETLVTIAQTVHQISLDEWRGVQFQAAGHRGDANFGNYDQGPPLQVASGVDSSADAWSIEVALATSGEQHQVVWQWDTAGFGIPNQDQAKITSVVDDRRTYVLAELPRDVAVSAHLQVSPAGQDPVLLPFVDPDPDFDRTFAAYVFSEPVAFTAQIIGADGAVLSNWPST